MNTSRRAARLLFAASLIALIVSPSVHAQAIENYLGQAVAAGEVLVGVRALTPQDLTQLVQTHDLDIVQPLGAGGILRLHSRTRDVANLIAALANHPGLVYVEPNGILRASTLPNDPFFGDLWGLRNVGQAGGTADADIDADEAWDTTTGSRANVVGVIDSGADYDHPDLAANIWSAPSAFTVNIGGINITCPAGSHGFNAINNSCDPMDDEGHGTHVAGTIGAVGNNSLGVTGVNWTANMMILKFLNQAGNGTTADAVKAIQFAVQAKSIFGADANVRVLSNSWGGGGFSQSLLNAVQLANSSDMLFVAAAGNEGLNNDFFPTYPANYTTPNVVSVASTTRTDARSGFSNYGATTVDLGAPGSSILSTYPGGYAFLSGTSMATPHVSGAAALILSVCNLDTATLKSTILDNVDVVNSMVGVTATGGRLNVDRAVDSCSAPPNPNFTTTASPSSRSITAGSSTTYTVGITPAGGFNSAVNLSVAGLPFGASAGFSANPILPSETSTLTVTTTTGVAPGTYPLTITGTSGTLTSSVNVTLQITTNADFTLSVAPPSQTIDPGQSAVYTVNLESLGGFNGTVNLSITGLPSRANAVFSPASLTGSNASTLTITTAHGGPSGTFPLTIVGASGSLTRTAQATLVIVPTILLAASPGSQTVDAGAGTSFTVNVYALGGFTGTTALSVAGLPAGAGASFTPPSINGTGSSVLSIGTAPGTNPGTYDLTITGTSGTLVRTVSATLVVNAGEAQDFSLSAAPPSTTVNPGQTAPYTLDVTATGGFNGVVAFSVAGLPSGATGTFTPASVTGSGSASLAVSTLGSTPPGTYPLTITGTSGALVRSAPVELIVVPAPDFSLTAAPPSTTVNPGQTAPYTLDVTATGGFNGVVAFSVAGLPSGATGTFTPASVTGSGSASLAVSTLGSTPPGTYPLTITGTSGALVRSAPVELIVVSAPDFSLTAAPESAMIDPGQSAVYTVDVNAIGGFAGAVSLSVSGLPSRGRATFSPASVQGGGSSTLTVTTAHGGPSGTFTLTITGVSGGQTRTATVTLVIIPSILVAATPASQTVAAGATAVYGVNVYALGGFSGVVSFSVVGLPSGASGSFNPAATNGTGQSTLTVTTNSGVAAGTYPLIVRATSGSLVRETSVSLTITP